MGTLKATPVRAGRLSPVWTLLRLLGGWALVALLAYVLWSPGEWPTRLFAWVLLTILADEFGGWFGYIGALLGGLPFFTLEGASAQWAVTLPLVGGALLALLLVKHSGGAFVLPFAGAIFALPLLALARYGTKLDPSLTLPGNETFLRNALTAMLIGLAFSFVRQLVGVGWRYGARRREARAATAGVAVSAPTAGPAAAAQTPTEVIIATPAAQVDPLPASPAPGEPGRQP